MRETLTDEGVFFLDALSGDLQFTFSSGPGVAGYEINDQSVLRLRARTALRGWRA